MLLDCLKQAEVGQRMLLAWVSFLALPTCTLLLLLSISPKLILE
jgi:hypothetical protein